MALSISPRLRALLIVGVLALAALAAGMMVLGRGHASNNAQAKPKPPVTPATAFPKASPSTPATPTGEAPSAPSAPKGEGALPAAIQQALTANRVVVVSLFAPKAKIDTTALREAAAGAQLAGAVFVPIDVTRDDVDSLKQRYGVIQDPAVLVLRPPGDLIVRIDGFADRDTVAQAAANAAS